MPVTAKLSRKFYETFGDELANELVEWLNQVDAAYRSDLRDLNELNFARFDAKLDARLADLRSELIDRKSTRLNSSHSQISYAVFCLKKKKKHYEPTRNYYDAAVTVS